MLVFRAKKEKMCNYCKTMVLRNEWIVIQFFTDKDNYKRVFCYHADTCYMKHQEAVFKKIWEHAQEARKEDGKKVNPERKKIGRPSVPTTDRKRRRQLLSLVIYHKKAGNVDLAAKAQVELDSITNKGVM